MIAEHEEQKKQREAHFHLWDDVLWSPMDET